LIVSFRQLALSLQPFCDPGGEVYLTVEVAGESKPQVIPLDSKHAKAVVRNRLCDLVKRGFPTDHETRTAIDVLHGYAFEQKRQVAETSLEHLIGNKPLAQAVEVIANKGGTQKTPKQLLAAVNSVAMAEHIDTRSPAWPVNEDALGKQMSSLKELLKRLGVFIESSRGDERHWTIRPYSPESDEGVGKVSGDNPMSKAISNPTDTSTSPSTPLVTGNEAGRPGAVADDELNNLLNGVVK
jgi:hypothetical protein